MIQATESIRRSVVVPVARERAFEVFTAGMTGWWPSDHHIGSAPIEQIVIEPREGGRWYTRHTDGSETVDRLRGRLGAARARRRHLADQRRLEVRPHRSSPPSRCASWPRARIARASSSSTATSTASAPTPSACTRPSSAPGAWDATLAAFAAGAESAAA